MGRDRKHFFSALAGVIVGVMLVAVLPAAADDGDRLILGETNTATSPTKVWARRGVLFRASKADTPAATFLVRSGPPIAVGSNAWVKDLNADLLDGRDASMMARAAICAEDDAPDGVDYQCSMEINAPRPGILVMSGSIDLWRTDSGGDLLHCRFTVDDVEVPGSERAMDMRVPENAEANCATDAALVVDTGIHDVVLETVSVAPTTKVAYVGGYVVYVPFDGAGEVPVP
jgi:hypothetical protein